MVLGVMTGELNQISRVIGQLEASLGALSQTFRDHCRDDDTRHSENIATMQSIDDKIVKLTETLAPLTKAVSAMQPIVDGYQISKWKLAGALSLASFILAGIAWAITSFAVKGISWLLSK